MPVRPSRPTETERILADFSSPDPIVRESASARLAVHGRRAVAGLRRLATDDAALETARIAALRTLFLVDVDAGVGAAAMSAESPHEDLACEALTSLGEVLREPTRESAADEALAVLTRVALTTTASGQRRLLALRAVSALPVSLHRPLRAQLENDEDPEVAAWARHPISAESQVDSWLATGRLPDDPRAAAEAAEHDAHQMPVTALRRAIDLVRKRERDAASPAPWRTVRARLHVALARRNSTIALYDLRETLERMSEPLDEGFVAAALAVGDATCLEAIAARWAAATDDEWLRGQLERIFSAAAARSQMTRGAALMTKITRRWPEAAPLLATVPRRRSAT